MSKFIIFIDTETGGVLDHQPTIQLAAVAMNEDTWREVANFETKIQFDESACDPEALKMNHYDPEVWKQSAVPVAEACRRFALFVGPYKSLQMISKRTGAPYSVAKLGGYNALTFDGPRVRRMFQDCGVFFPCSFHIRDVLQRAMWFVDESKLEKPPENLKLGTMCEYFGINIDGAHDALADCRLTAELAKRMRAPTQEAISA